MIAGKPEDLHRSIWLWCVPLPLLIQLGARQLDSQGDFFSKWIDSESGFIENATAVLLIPATIVALGLALRFYRRLGVVYFCWFFLVALVCFGFAGEEISWGQHWLGWQSPDYFVAHNRQGETNFHNLNIHLGRVVKSLLTLVIIAGGLIMPLLGRTRSHKHTGNGRFLDIVTPTAVCVPAAAFVFGVRLVERFKTWFDLDWGIIAVNLKESQELYIALFLLIYVLSARVRASAMLRSITP